ncbi:H/ACA ribonucleoprotein complex subunit 1 [Nematocida sp. AWRm77]|nr:H/ACA ribonucleoprotein complex subunit 1 [Nematocida sp. AWRm77]
MGRIRNNAPTPRAFPQMRIGRREMPDRPENLIKIGEASHTIQNTNMLVIKLTENIVPYFSAGIYGEGNRVVGGVHEVYGKLDGNAYCCLRIEEKLSASSFAPGSIFKADKFKCLTYDRINGASKIPSVRTNSAVPKPEIRHQKSTKYRTKTQQARVIQYAEKQIARDRRDFRENKNYFLKKTVEKRGDHMKLYRKVQYTEE